MRNIKLNLQYDGSVFHGWQFQPNCDSVELQLKLAIEHILHEQVKLQSCSRTDTGVHALDFCCNFKTQSDISEEKLQVALNAVLPKQIVVIGCETVSEQFHARYECKGKRYLYRIWNSKTRNPFLLDRALQYPFKLDDALMDRQAQFFVGTHDFAAFCASGSSVKTTVRTIYACSVAREGDLVTFCVTGNGFLYNMVRIMVGTLLDINAGKLPEDCIPTILESKDRTRAGITAKAQGLYLDKVFYEDGELCGAKSNTCK